MLYYRSSGGTNYVIDSGVTLAVGVRYFICAYVGATGSGLRVYDGTGLVGSAIGTGVTLNSSSRNLVIADCDPPVQYSFSGYLDGLALFGSALATSRMDELAGYAVGPRQPWAQRSSGILPRNGTTTQTIPFTPAAAGSLLVAVVASAVTAHTAVTPGWTKRLSPNSRGELAVFTRTANVGDSTLQLTLSDANLPLLYTIYEFASGCSWHSGAANFLVMRQIYCVCLV